MKHWKSTAVFIAAAVFFGVALWVNLKEPDLWPSQKALALFNAGEYKQAALECEKTQDLQIAVPFSDVCHAYMSYEEGDVKEARRRLNTWEYLRKNSKTEYPEYFLKQVLAFKEQVESEYIELIRKENAEAEAKRKAAQPASQRTETPQAEVPYMGMSESRISETALGAPSRTEFIDNKFGEGKLGFYYWDRDGKNIFVARTEDNKVRSTTDMRKVKTTRKTTQTQEKSDPYDVYSYTNEEDFYDDHYDDFLDYEEAEAYWRDHQ